MSDALHIFFRRLMKLTQWLRLILHRVRYPGASQIMVTSMDLVDNRTVACCLPQKPAFYSRLLPSRAGWIAGWGRKWSGLRAVQIAKQYGIPFVLLEDGFLRSFDRHDNSISLVMDQRGIYYDANEASDLEELVSSQLTNKEILRTKELISLWRDSRLSKYNASQEHCDVLPNRYVLVIDQTFGDASISYGLAKPASFDRMLELALSENPLATIIVKSHPDTSATRKMGYLDGSRHLNSSRVKVIRSRCHPVRLIECADAVYTVTSQVGFDALIWGKPVRTFGMPFYAGWGLTQDDLPQPSRRSHATLEQLVHAALVKYPRYLDPVTMRPCEVEDAIAHIALQRRNLLAMPEKITAIGFSRWKRSFICKFMSGTDIVFQNRIKAQRSTEPQPTYLVWGSKEPANLPKNARVLRIEDGFLRSSGLGADLVRPLSLIIDDIGIYYDSTRDSRLQRILAQQDLAPVDLQRARNLRQRICDTQVTKYNLAHAIWTRPQTEKPVLLVVGQVEGDASIKFGSPKVKTNIDLLRRVRQENPDSYIIYKPHPDVTSGLRPKGDKEQNAAQFCDQVLTEQVSTGHLLGQVDGLHTMTSLMGFEALLRGTAVTCHGIPFYAGWGLTTDKLTCPARQRKISLDELVYGALIAYPRYFNYETNCFVSPEQALDQLVQLSRNGPKTRSWHRKILRKALIFKGKVESARA